MSIVYFRLFMLFLLAVLIFGVLTAVLLRSKDAIRWVVGSILVICAAALVIVAGTGVYTQWNQPAIDSIQPASFEKRAAILQTDHAFNAWDTDGVQDYVPDLFSSVDSACQYLAREIITQMEQLSNDDSSQDITLNVRDTNNMVSPATRAIHQALEELTNTRSSILVGDHRIEKASVVIKVIENTPDSLNTAMANPQRKQSVSIVILQDQDILFTRSADYYDKPWVEDASVLTAINTDTTWMRVRCDKFTASEDEVEQRTLNRAAFKLTGLIRHELNKHSGSGVAQLQQMTDGQLASQIHGWIPTANIIADQFTQRFNRPYGNIYRQAILLNVSSEKIQWMAEQLIHVQDIQARNQRVVTTVRYTKWFSAACMIGLIFVIYLFLNAATRGYYVIAMRIASAVLVAVVLFLLLSVS